MTVDSKKAFKSVWNESKIELTLEVGYIFFDKLNNKYGSLKFDKNIL